MRPWHRGRLINIEATLVNIIINGDWLHTKLWKQDNRFIYVTYFIIINQLILWDPLVNYYSISRRQGSTFNPRLSVSLHQLSGTLCLPLLKVPLPSPPSGLIWIQNCSLLHTTRSNISSAAGASDSNSRHTAPPINVFDMTLTLVHWYKRKYYVNICLQCTVNNYVNESGPQSTQCVKVSWLQVNDVILPLAKNI